MSPEQVEIILRLGTALLIGGLIGLERELQGRPAGLRTHMLVCLASALLMQITVVPIAWLGPEAGETLTVDASRVVQGIMAGIGFLGAGEIFRHGWNVRGLTTAASIWITSSLGVVVGLGQYDVAAVSTTIIILVLAVLGWFEARLPVEIHVRHTIRFARRDAMEEGALRELLHSHGFAIAELSHALIDSGRAFEYRLNLKTRDGGASERLSCSLRGKSDVIEFDISPRGE
jgi:putative Mg2+ transporter-C (MgtC) family protein